MSKVFGAVMLREMESLDGDGALCWPAGLESVEARRDWRLRLARKNWNIFSRPTLGNTRAVVRYLARYTSRIAMSNHRIRRVDGRARTVSFVWKDYRNGGRAAEPTMAGKEFIWRLSRHLVPKGLRRVRYFGLLAGKRNGFKELPGARKEHRRGAGGGAQVDLQTVRRPGLGIREVLQPARPGWRKRATFGLGSFPKALMHKGWELFPCPAESRVKKGVQQGDEDRPPARGIVDVAQEASRHSLQLRVLPPGGGLSQTLHKE